LGGRGKVDITAHGAEALIEFPLKSGASILDTHAPIGNFVFGGSIDMRSESSLAGQRILVLEDDYYLAGDTANALRAAGAEVVGPFPQETPAIQAVYDGDLTGAVVDLNLGGGPTFATARALRQAQVPFIFLTGYDRSSIREGFDEVPQLEKPVEPRQIVNTLNCMIETAVSRRKPKFQSELFNE
jgi:DNA-binding response OmpR family regulator